MSSSDIGKIWTASGRSIDINSPSMRDISIEDIATHLSRINRFNGATWRPYSVAQHSVAVADYLSGESIETRQWGLLHDAHEAYVGDITRPVAEFLNSDLLQTLKRKFDVAISCRFDVFAAAVDEGVKVREADDAILDIEIRYRVHREIDQLTTVPRIVAADYSPDEARDLFLSRFYELWPDLRPAGRVA